jgi:hypothetical protein
MADERGEPAPHFDFYGRAGRRGQDHDGGDQLAQGPYRLAMAAVLLMAIFTVHLPYGFTSIKLMAVTAAGPRFGPPGYETDLLYLACLAALVAGGSGPFSVDRFIANRLSRNGNVAMLPAGDCFNSGLISQYTPLACPTTEGPVPKKNAKAQFSPRGAIAPRASGTIWEKPVE